MTQQQLTATQELANIEARKAALEAEIKRLKRQAAPVKMRWSEKGEHIGLTNTGNYLKPEAWEFIISRIDEIREAYQITKQGN